MPGTVEGCAQSAATTQCERDLDLLLDRERGAVARPLLEALLAARCWGTPEPRAAATRLLERHARWVTDLNPGVAFLVGAPSAHQSDLFFDWLEGGKDRTHEVIGAPRGMNAPAVGDAMARAGRRIRAELAKAPPPWTWLVAELRRRLGSVTTEELLGDAIERAGAVQGTRSALLLAWMAGPYTPVRGHPGWLARDPATLLSRSTSSTRAEGGVRPLADVSAELVDLELAAVMLVPWLQELGAAVVHDLVVVTTGPLVDAVERILDAHGTARSVAQIAEDLEAGGRAVTEPSLRAAVRGRRFQVTADGVVGLAAWCDGQLMHPAPPRVVRASQPEPGPVGRRPRSAPEPPDLHVRERVWLRVLVDEAVIRGDEAVVPVDLVGHLGLGSKGRRTFSCRWGPITLANEGTHPTRGSLRATVRAVGAQLGDALLLGFSSTGDVTVEIRGASYPDPAGLRAGVPSAGEADSDLLVRETVASIVRTETS